MVLLIRGGDIDDTLDNAIGEIIGVEHMPSFIKIKKKLRIVILFDAYDEISAKSSSDVHFLKIIGRKETNITFVMSTRRHKTDQILSGGINAPMWQIVRCNGVNSESVKQFLASNSTEEHVENIYSALKENNLHHNPLFILMARQTFSMEPFKADVNLDMYTLLSKFCNGQLNKLYNVTKQKIDDLEPFYNILGWFAIDSEAVEPIHALNVFYKQQRLLVGFKVRLQEEVNSKNIEIMNIKEISAIASDAGLLSINCKETVYDKQYSFMHKAVAEFAVARLLYNTKMWKYADTLYEEKWSMPHYYLLSHAINENKQSEDRELWNFQINYSFDFNYNNGKFQIITNIARITKNTISN